MTKAMAYKILGITPGTALTDIKKKYRQLMHRVHPDTEAFSTRAYDFTAQEINEAYDFLRKNMPEERLGKADKNTTSSRKQHGKTAYRQSYWDENATTGSTAKQMKWDAPLNKNAYTARTVYHYAEDADGEIIGSFPAASGKYLWILEEDFPLFLKSMFECSKRLLDHVDAQIRRENVCPKQLKFQAELSYLLAQQFIDATSTLKRLLTPEVLPDADIYSIASMLELAADAPVLRSGMTLYPSCIRDHRLFLTTKSAATLPLFPIEDYASEIIAGIDEAGRGPLCGNVVAAAVILDPARPIEGLRDSKKLSEARREELAPVIRERALAWGVGEATPEEIDRLNILQATFLAMQRALEGLTGGSYEYL